MSESLRSVHKTITSATAIQVTPSTWLGVENTYLEERSYPLPLSRLLLPVLDRWGEWPPLATMDWPAFLCH